MKTRMQYVHSRKKIASQALIVAEPYYKEMIALYDIRIDLLQEVTPELRSQATGVEIEGVQELRGEMEQVMVTFLFQALVTPNLARRMISEFKQAPLPVVVIILKLIIVVILFRIWRRWARNNINRIHRNLLDTRSRSRFIRYSAQFFWYMNRLRHPLEWLILVGLFFKILETEHIQVIDDIL